MNNRPNHQEKGTESLYLKKKKNWVRISDAQRGTNYIYAIIKISTIYIAVILYVLNVVACVIIIIQNGLVKWVCTTRTIRNYVIIPRTIYLSMCTVVLLYLLNADLK